MILVHRQQSALAPFAHRRHPSAPVVVQPTRTPGLLSLSKPVQRQQPVQAKPRSSPKAKQPKAPAQDALKPSPEIILKKSPPSTEKQSARGRGSKDKSTTRSSSHSAVRGRRNNARQQSPPIPTSRAEVPSPTYKPNANLFDPFLDDSNNFQSKPTSQQAFVPTLASSPTGKLARRRQPVPANTPSKAIPVPRAFNSSVPNMSRSEPTVSSHMRSRNGKVSRDVFPICDDLTDTEDSEEDSTPPVTPTRSRPVSHFTLNGPRTAPIAASLSSFPFTVSSTPSPTGKRRSNKHLRSPSEGVFLMSDDEPATLLRLTAKRGPLTDESEQEREAAAAAAAAYFASSNFQNSPSPEELPPPTFAFV
ncbi:hypothetical protein BDP27DRAFT_29191 [Rhodocollybia butyracea]|uniref:Uncharacterized protein n=1 Tax=Rhodocollybia butyracea TaxID=206335 RepID=A0A9P5Q5F0_9AGAR|nr:hypothetical protein BDP27DRAFT_29191 [Rhodocollybia butyracea]